MPRIKKFGRRRCKYVNTQVSSDVNSNSSILSEDNVNITSNSTNNTSDISTNSESNSRPSLSKQKLKNVQLCAPDNEYFGDHFRDGNVIINLDILNKVISKFALCKLCKKNVGLEIFELPEARKGIVSKLQLMCKNCNASTSFMSSSKTKTGYYENNVRLVYACRSIGKGRAGAQTFCSIMNLPQPPTKFTMYNKVLTKSISEVAKESMQIATINAINENDGDNDISVIFDGTWQKRGHTSLNGVVTVTSLETGKVLDVECMSKYCNICKGKKLQSHDGCLANYSGTSGGMEINGVLKIYERSNTASNPARYTSYLGDGDSKAFETVKNNKVYGDGVDIQKLECIGHIQKRMGGRLLRLKEKTKGILLSDGKPLSGKGRLTNTVIKDLQSYYGNSIRKNCDSVENMKKSIWATYFHKSSTLDKPMHGLCPEGVESWCKYNRSKALKVSPTPTNNLPIAVMEHIKPVYKDLADPNLLKKCVHGKTQNQNESFNNMIWTRISKNNFVGLSTLTIGVQDAILCYNDGALGKIKVLQKLCGQAGTNCVVGLKRQDELRIFEAEKAMKDIEKKAKEVRITVKRRILENEEDPDDPAYGYGAH